MASKHYGKLNNEVVRLIMERPKLSAHALRLFIWMMQYAKCGERLKGKEAAELNSWLVENAPGIEPKDVQTVQFSYSQAAREVFSGQNNAAVRQVERLTKEGVIELISKGSRGHASLYLVGNKYTLCVPNSKVNKYTSSTEKVHIEGEISTHAEPVTSGDKTYPIDNPINNPGGASASAKEEAEQQPLCPVCGKPMERTGSTRNERRERLYLCRICGWEEWVDR